MNLMIEGLKNSYELEMLIKAFYPWEKITKTHKLGDEGLTISIQVLKIIEVSMYLDGQKIHHLEEAIQSVNEKILRGQIKRLIYRLLSKELEMELPWGILTGVRPTKLAVAWLKQGESEGSICNRLKNEYLVSESKSQLMLQVAQEELKVLNAYKETDYSLYIGIPFCPSKCHYCSFTSYPINQWNSSVKSYLKALEKEMAFVADKYKHKRLRTIYVGGGTPTSITAEDLNWLFDIIRKYFDLSYLDEWTVEAGRPDSITKDKLAVIKDNQVSRISINPQTMHQKTLDLIGRDHTVEEVKEIFFLARNMGFDNINMDMILGLPNEGITEIKETLRVIEDLKPDNLTVHTLAYKRGALLNNQPKTHKEVVLDEVLRMEEAVASSAKAQGLLPYYLYRQKNMVGNLHNIGYAKEGKLGIYNILIMEEQQSILALGAGAVSKLFYPDENRIERIENVKNVSDYIKRIDEMILRKERQL